MKQKINRHYINILNFIFLTVWIVIGFVYKNTALGGQASEIPTLLFFTYQSNIIIWVWVTLEILNKYIKNERINLLIENDKIHVAVTSWITVTMVAATVVLGPVYGLIDMTGTIHASVSSGWTVIIDVVLHVVTPLLFIASYYLKENKQKHDYKTYIYSFAYIIIYQIGAMTYGLITGIFPYYVSDFGLVDPYWPILFSLIIYVIAAGSIYLFTKGRYEKRQISK